MLSNSLSNTSTILIPKADKETTKKKKIIGQYH